MISFDPKRIAIIIAKSERLLIITTRTVTSRKRIIIFGLSVSSVTPFAKIGESGLVARFTHVRGNTFDGNATCK